MARLLSGGKASQTLLWRNVVALSNGHLEMLLLNNLTLSRDTILLYVHELLDGKSAYLRMNLKCMEKP